MQDGAGLCFIWRRYLCHHEPPLVLTSQVAALRRHAKAQGYTIAEEYVCLDDGVSGVTLVRRGLDRMRNGAQAGQLDAVVLLSPDRLSRKYAYLILIQEEFERLGASLIFLEQRRFLDDLSVST